MIADWLEQLRQHNATQRAYTQRDFQAHFSDDKAQAGLRDFMRRCSHRPLKEFAQTSDDWHALVVPSFQATIAEYGAVNPLPENLITGVTEDRDHSVKRWLWKSEPIEDYLEGEAFKETYIEGATAITRWRKPGAKIAETYEASKDLPLDVIQANIRLTSNEFRVREWKHFMHELHKSTSNLFPMNATDKNGQPLDDVAGWRALFDNAYDPESDPYTESLTWTNIKDARAKMLRRERDAVRPDVIIINASTEAYLSESLGVNNAAFLGGSDTFFRTGSLPNVYGLTFIVVPDAHFGFFVNDVTRRNDEFTRTNDAFLLTTQNGPTILRHNREPLSTETWRIYDGQKQAMNLWERYDFGTFRYTNIMRIVQPFWDLSGTLETLE